MNREDLYQDVYRPRGGSLQQWGHLDPSGQRNEPYGEADELARIANDLQNQGVTELIPEWD